MSLYPPNWPRCPNCARPVLDGHITCGDARCDESGERNKRDQIARSAGRAIEQAYPWGYRSEDSEP